MRKGGIKPTPEELLVKYETALADAENRAFLNGLPSGLTKRQVRKMATAFLWASEDRASKLAHLYEAKQRRPRLFWQKFDSYQRG